MNVSGVICMTSHLNQVPYGPIDLRSVVTIAMRAQNKTFVAMADVSARHTVASLPIHSPVVYNVLSVLAMERVEIS